MQWPMIQPQINANLALHQLVVQEGIVYVSSGGIYASVRCAPTNKASGVPYTQSKMHKDIKQ